MLIVGAFKKMKWVFIMKEEMNKIGFFPSFYHALVKFEYFAMGFEFYLGRYVKTF